MNFNELIQDFYRTDSVNDIPPVFTDTNEEYLKNKRMINLALEEIFNEDWNFRKTILTFQTVVGQSAYPMPAGIIEKKGVKIGDNVLTLESDPYALNTDSGTPTKYYVYGSNLVLYPTPDETTTVTVYYLTSMSGLTAIGTPRVGLSAETDAPNIPENFHDLVVRKAELIYMRDDPKTNNAQAMADVQKRINQLKTLDSGTLEASSRFII